MNQPEALLGDLDSCVIDRPDEGVFLVNRALFTDPRVLELEFEHIFEKTWVYLCHESQIANPFDFVTSAIGRVPVIINRGRSGEIGGLVNSCAHRGATVCIEERGNGRAFTCPYHAWTYDAGGKCIGIKEREKGGYPKAFETADHDLTRVPKIANYRGFIFGCLNPLAPSIEDHLGAARHFVDLLADQAPQGFEVLRGSSRYTYRGNWKMQAENGVDGYHVTNVHASYLGLLKLRADTGKDSGGNKHLIDGAIQRNGCYDLSNGHAVLWFASDPERNPVSRHRDRLSERHGDLRTYWMLNRSRNLLIYPNLFLMDQLSTQIRVFRPLAPDLTEVRIYCLAPKDEEADARERRIRNYEDFFNASGLGSPDDLAMFEACQRGYEGRFERNYSPYDRGMARMIRGADEPAIELGVTPYSSSPRWEDETLFHGQYREWLRLMRNGPGNSAGV